MTFKSLVAIGAASAILVLASIGSAQVLKADYQFQGNLTSSVGTAPSLTSLTGSGGPTSFVSDMVDGYSRQMLRFPFNSGVAIPLTGVVPDSAFTAVILFKMDDMTGRRRLFDVSGGLTADDGGFILDGRLEGEPTTNLASLNNTYVQIVIVRTGTGMVVGYRDGFQRLSGPDDGSPLPFGIRLFQDAVNNPVLAAPGNLVRLRLYDAPMTAQQVHQLDRVPETPTGTLPILFFTTRNGQFEIYRANSNGTSQVRLTNTEATELVARFSPDGQKILYQKREAAGQPQQIWVANADGSNPIRLTNTLTDDISGTWRPDGRKIIFARCVLPLCDLYMMNPDGSDQVPIAAANTPTGDEDQPQFTPNGQKLVFLCSDANGTNYQICVANADGTNRVAITNTTAPIVSQQFDISPDSQRIAFIRNSLTVAGTAGNDVYTMGIDGSNVTNIVNNATSDTTPQWSPDGSQIIFGSARAGGINDIWVMNANGTSPARLTFNSFDDRPSDWYTVPSGFRKTPFDFDGDTKTDIGIFRPGPAEWWISRSSNASVFAAQFGATTDRIVPGDYTGDGKTDVAVWRPGSGEWFVLRSEDFSFFAFPFGSNGDTPAPADYDADGKADAAVFRSATGTWFIRRSSDGGTTIEGFGGNGDVPVPADYDGDGKADIAIFRTAVGQWWLNRSTAGVIATTFGNASDKPVQGDYTGDGKSDVAFWRPSTGDWFVLRSEDFSFFSFPFGTTGDIPAPGDYDGDGKFDATVFRPSNATWFSQRSTAGTLIQQFGATGDRPIPNAYVP